jgi:uncharacterized protein
MSDRRELILFDEIDKYGPQQYIRTLAVSPSEVNRHELASLGPLSIEAHARKGELPGEYVVDGTVRFTADLTCARCVEPFPFATSSAFHLRYRPRPVALQQGNEELEITPHELDIEFYSERTGSLREVAMEQIQLSIPMKPLCHEQCLGLCPTCGANRNREDCQCEATIGDERWGALREIRQQIAKKRES